MDRPHSPGPGIPATVSRFNQRLKRSGGRPPRPDVEVYLDTLIEQCEQGFDLLYGPHAAVLSDAYVPMTARPALNRHRLARAARIMASGASRTIRRTSPTPNLTP